MFVISVSIIRLWPRISETPLTIHSPQSRDQWWILTTHDDDMTPVTSTDCVWLPEQGWSTLINTNMYLNNSYERFCILYGNQNQNCIFEYSPILDIWWEIWHSTMSVDQVMCDPGLEWSLVIINYDTWTLLITDMQQVIIINYLDTSLSHQSLLSITDMGLRTWSAQSRGRDSLSSCIKVLMV